MKQSLWLSTMIARTSLISSKNNASSAQLREREERAQENRKTWMLKWTLPPSNVIWTGWVGLQHTSQWLYLTVIIIRATVWMYFGGLISHHSKKLLVNFYYCSPQVFISQENRRWPLTPSLVTLDLYSWLNYGCHISWGTLKNWNRLKGSQSEF